ncbi:HNH endonuclease signature motif containing protein, partial [Dactylosporangium sp. NPDC005555]|uniref:HNH endonuclease n=1 Tax=Dactylosporangium sp. NPDC005555 TaxID=3154889 RepID=UPI0033BEC2D4
MSALPSRTPCRLSVESERPDTTTLPRSVVSIQSPCRQTPGYAQVRAEVWRRDGGACVECQATEYLEFDHVIPWSRGGATSAGNLQLLCRRCNLAKG